MAKYFKSFFAGIAAAVIYLLLFGIVVTIRTWLPLEQGFSVDNGSYSFNGPWIPLWPIVIGAPLIFSAASYWQYKRISRAGKAPR